MRESGDPEAQGVGGEVGEDVGRDRLGKAEGIFLINGD
jgi:hypothetical protein